MDTQTFGRYEIKKQLGKGGMATVYLAHDPNFGRDVALKVLPRQFLHDEQFRGRFEREAKTIAALEHKAIVPVYDFGEHDGQPYLVMRYMLGGALDGLIKEQGALSPAEAAKIITRIASALDAAHQKGIVHRDLKPGNVLFDGEGDAYLSDFGIVKLSEATANLTGNAIVGTPAYMSPEQVHGKHDIDGRSDIYTLAVMLYEMLTGAVPYPAKTPTQQMMAHVLEPVPEVTTARRDLSPLYNEVVHKGMAKEPAGRYQTAGELAGAFNTAVSQQTNPYTPLYPTPDHDQTSVMPTPLPLDQTLVEQPAEPEPSDTQVTPIPFGVGQTDPAPASPTPIPTPPDPDEEPPPSAVAEARASFPNLAGEIEQAEESKTGFGKYLLWGCGVPLIVGLVLLGICTLSLLALGAIVDSEGEDEDVVNVPTAVETPQESSVRIDELVSELRTEPTVTPTPVPEVEVENTAVVEPTTPARLTRDPNLVSEVSISFDNEDDWAVGEISSPTGELEASALIEDGQMVMTGYLPNYIFWATAGLTLGEGYYFVDSIALEGPLDNGYGLMLFTDTELDDFYRFQISSDGYVLITYCEDGCESSTPLVDDGWFPSDTIEQGLGEWNELSVTAVDGVMEFYVNGEFVGSTTYDDAPTGDVGFIMDTQSPEETVVIAFDDFEFVEASED